MSVLLTYQALLKSLLSIAHAAPGRQQQTVKQRMSAQTEPLKLVTQGASSLTYLGLRRSLSICFHLQMAAPGGSSRQGQVKACHA